MSEYINEYSFANSYLADGDFILWRGKPEKGLTFASTDIFTSLFGIVWLAFVIFWTGSVIESGAPLPMALFAIPFFAIGIYFAGGRVIVTELMKSKTFYVITNRAIIKKCARRVDVMYFEHNYTMQVITHKNGTTTFIFDTHIVTHRVNNTPQTKKITLDNILDAEGVHSALLQMQNSYSHDNT